MRYEDIKRQALTKWETQEKSKLPRIHVGTATCGRSSGALRVIERLQSELEQRGIDARITEVGCIGSCYCLIQFCEPQPYQSSIDSFGAADAALHQSYSNCLRHLDYLL